MTTKLTSQNIAVVPYRICHCLRRCIFSLGECSFCNVELFVQILSAWVFDRFLVFLRSVFCCIYVITVWLSMKALLDIQLDGMLDEWTNSRMIVMMIMIKLMLYIAMWCQVPGIRAEFQAAMWLIWLVGASCRLVSIEFPRRTAGWAAGWQSDQEGKETNRFCFIESCLLLHQKFCHKLESATTFYHDSAGGSRHDEVHDFPGQHQWFKFASVLLVVRWERNIPPCKNLRQLFTEILFHGPTCSDSKLSEECMHWFDCWSWVWLITSANCLAILLATKANSATIRVWVGAVITGYSWVCSLLWKEMQVLSNSWLCEDHYCIDYW